VLSARVFLSGAAPVPWRSRATEEAIVGTTLDGATIEKAAADAVEGAEPLSQNGYKVALFEGLMKERLEAIKG
jgi:xanthine dehydrogenase YagS FAD-binding subunit